MENLFPNIVQMERKKYREKYLIYIYTNRQLKYVLSIIEQWEKCKYLLNLNLKKVNNISGSDITFFLTDNKLLTLSKHI